jgi:hypothetical protein
MSRLGSNGKKKGKAVAEREITKEAVKSKRKANGWKLVRGESAGKLAVRDDEEEIIFAQKQDAIAFIHQNGDYVKVEKQELSDLTEGHFKAAEVWRCTHGVDIYYWFLERL